MLVRILLAFVIIVTGTLLFLYLGSRKEDKENSDKGLKKTVEFFGDYTDKVEYQVGRFVLLNDQNHRLLIDYGIIDDRIIMRMRSFPTIKQLHFLADKGGHFTKGRRVFCAGK